MKDLGKSYNNGQPMAEQKGKMLTYFFKNGDIKAQGKYVDGLMQGKWIFRKKEGYLWQVGHFDAQGKQDGTWLRYNADGSVQDEKLFDHGERIS